MSILRILFYLLFFIFFLMCLFFILKKIVQFVFFLSDMSFDLVFDFFLSQDHVLSLFIIKNNTFCEFVISKILLNDLITKGLRFHILMVLVGHDNKFFIVILCSPHEIFFLILFFVFYLLRTCFFLCPISTKFFLFY